MIHIPEFFVNVYETPSGEIIHVRPIKTRKRAEHDYHEHKKAGCKLLYRLKVKRRHLVEVDGVKYRVRKAWRVSVPEWSDHSDIMYGPTASKVRYTAWLRLSDCSELNLTEIEVKRAAIADHRMPLRDPLANQLSAEARHCLLHSYGANYDPIKAGYRDYFYTYRDDARLVECENLGLMTAHPGNSETHPDMVYFILTDLGKKVALSLTPEYGW